MLLFVKQRVISNLQGKYKVGNQIIVKKLRYPQEKFNLCAEQPTEILNYVSKETDVRKCL